MGVVYRDLRGDDMRTPARYLILLLFHTVLAAGPARAGSAQVIAEAGGPVTALDISGDGVTVVVGRDDGAVLLFDSATLQRMRLLGMHADGVSSVAWSAGDDSLATASHDGKVRLWDMPTGSMHAEFDGHAGGSRSIAFSPDGSVLASGGDDNTVRLWNPETGDELLALTGHTAQIRAVAFSPSGRWLASGDDDRSVRVWNARTGLLRQRFRWHEGKVRGVAFAADDRLATSGSDGTVRLIDIDSGTQRRQLQAHAIGRHGKVRALRYTADRRFFVTGSEDRTARLWETQGWTLVAVLRGHAGYVTSAAFSANDSHILTGSIDGTVRKWRLATGTAGSTERRPVERLAEGRVRNGDTFRDCERCPEMTWIGADSFRMGSPDDERGRDDDEGPLHPVTFASRFALGVHELRWSEWQLCADAGACRVIAADPGSGPGMHGRPVALVSWQDAQDYVAWLTRTTGKRYRLPSEAEWEYAARAGSPHAYPFGEDESALCLHANGADLATDFNNRNRCFDGVGRRAGPVGQYRANGYGLYDMIGNLWEWTDDCLNRNYAGAPTDGSPWRAGDCGQRMLRGGSWGSYPHNLRSATRYSVNRDYRGSEVGFRVARD